MAGSGKVIRRLFIYRTLQDRDVFALQVELDDEGKVSLVSGKERGDEAIRIIGAGVEAADGSYVTPQDGAAYLDAVVAMLGRSSMWHAVPAPMEPPNQP